MIVKKLRAQKKWSQEQLALLSGLSVRTIQRVESGQSASIETLKSLASVLEVDISKLTEDITVIDKKSENWRALPWWFKLSFYGIRSRKIQLAIELFALVLGIAALFYKENPFLSTAFILSAYTVGWTIRYGDRKNVW